MASSNPEAAQLLEEPRECERKLAGQCNLNAAQCLLKLGRDTAEAARRAQTAADCEPSNAKALYVLAKCRRIAGNCASARELLRRCVELSGKELPEVTEELALCSRSSSGSD
eukprot:m51a1_g238 hypothetical protein (112) ;mRNA; f:129763-133218